MELILSRRTRLPAIDATANPAYSSEDRDFHPDRFAINHPIPGSRVLLLDDTWTTGSRIQSLAYALKTAGATAGATAVAAVVLGRHIRPTDEPAKPLLDRLRDAPWFALDRCAIDDQPGTPVTRAESSAPPEPRH